MKKISTGHILLVMSIIVQTVLGILLGVSGIKLSMVTAIILTQLTVVLPFIIYCILKKENPLKLIRFKKISVLSVILCFLVGIVYYPASIFINVISLLFVENAMTDVVANVLPFGMAAGVALLALLPAVVEETLFRGVIYNSYSKRRPLAGVFFSAFLFGLMHMNFNQMPYAMVLGIVLAFMMEACDSIIAPMIIHFTMNASSTLITFLNPISTTDVETNGASSVRSILRENLKMSLQENGTKFTKAQFDSIFILTLIVSIIMYLLIAAFFLALAFALVCLTFRVNKRKMSMVFKADHSDTKYLENRQGVMKKNRMIDIPILVFVVYSVVMCILAI